MKEFFFNAQEFLVRIGLLSGTDSTIDKILALLFIALAVLLCDLTCRKIAVLILHIHAKVTKQSDEESIHTKKVISAFAAVIPAMSIGLLLPIAFDKDSTWSIVLSRLGAIYFVIMFLLFLFALLNYIYYIYRKKRDINLPINILFQIAKYVFTLLAIIIICSILLDKSPKVLLTGLGASAAILSLIFKDSLVGLVSGIQLLSNKMLSIGDWITVPKYNADGIVREITLNTVKIQNFDDTTITLPPYTLLSDSFQNWDSMQKSGGRRIKRSINIDMHSIQFCTKETLGKYKQIELIKKPIEELLKNRQEGKKTTPFQTDSLTNLTIFRLYLEAYMAQQPTYIEGKTHMVRQLQPTENGLPLEIYFFTTEQRWEEYEKIQADMLDHILAAVNYFGLSVSQRV